MSSGLETIILNKVSWKCKKLQGTGFDRCISCARCLLTPRAGQYQAILPQALRHIRRDLFSRPHRN